jgi:hypothetical protein
MQEVSGELTLEEGTEWILWKKMESFLLYILKWERDSILFSIPQIQIVEP